MNEIFYLSHKEIYEAYFEKTYKKFTIFLHEIYEFWLQSDLTL